MTDESRVYNGNGGPTTNANLSAVNETNTRSAVNGVYGRSHTHATSDAAASDSELGSGVVADRELSDSGPTTNANLSEAMQSNTRSARSGVNGRPRMPATSDAAASDLSSGEADYRGLSEKYK